MKLAVNGRMDPEHLDFARQLGVTDVVNGVPDCDLAKGYYDFHDLTLQKSRIEDAGLTWSVLEGVPPEWCDNIKLGLPGRDEQIENWCRTVENMGAVGIPVLGYFFSLRNVGGNYGLRTSKSTRSRGGAIVTSFDYEQVKGARQDYWYPPIPHDLELSDEDMWNNITYFLKAVIPVAEKAGVRMSLHPDDPPVSPIGGIARVFRSHEALKRLVDIVPSEYNGLGFCQGTVSEMPGDALDAIRYFGKRGKINYVHFRFVSHPVPAFSETFIDQGRVDPMESLLAYEEAGVDCPMIDDHVPRLVLDPDGRHQTSRAYALGYMKALLDNVGRIGNGNPLS